MNSTETISYISIVVIAVSLFFIGTELTGFALVDTGIVNVTIDSSASIVFETTHSKLDFGNGTITPGQTAIVNSSGGKNAYWSGNSPNQGLILENNGNMNVSFTLKANKTDAAFIGGTSPLFELMVTNNETGSCGNIVTFDGAYANVNTTEQIACTNFGYRPEQDSVRIDAQLTMNDDAAGAKTVGITATATAI